MRPTINVFQEPLIEEILAEAKKILYEIGFDIRGKNLRQLLLERGLKKDPKNGRIIFPPEAVDQAIADAPSSFTLFDRNGQEHARDRGGTTYTSFPVPVD